MLIRITLLFFVAVWTKVYDKVNLAKAHKNSTHKVYNKVNQEKAHKNCIHNYCNF